MELLLPFVAAILVGTGVFLVLARALIRVILGLSLISYGVNLSILLSGGLSEGAPPLLDIPGPYVDPLPQALILTAIVIGFGTTALLLVLSIRAYQATGTDEVQELTEKPDPPAIVEPYADPERPSISPERGPAEDRPEKKSDKDTEAVAGKEKAAESGESKKSKIKDEVAETPAKAKSAKKVKRKKPKTKDSKAKEAEPSPAKKSAKKSKDDAVKPPPKSAEAESASESKDETLQDKDLEPKDLKPNDAEPNDAEPNDAEDDS